MDSCLQLREHFIVCQDAGNIQCHILVFESIVNEIRRRNAAVKQTFDFISHSLLKPRPKPHGDSFPPDFPRNVKSYHDAVEKPRIIGACLHRFVRVIFVIFLNFDSPDCSLHSIRVSVVMERLHRRKHRSKFIEVFTLKLLPQGLVFRHIGKPDSSDGIFKIHPGSSAYHGKETSAEHVGIGFVEVPQIAMEIVLLPSVSNINKMIWNFPVFAQILACPYRHSTIHLP